MKSNHYSPKSIVLGTCVGVLLLGSVSARAAMNVYLKLKSNGTDIQGEGSVQQIGGVDVSKLIEGTAVTHELFGGDTGRLQHTPFKFVKRVDKSSPLLYKALDRREVIDAEFLYFRPTPDGTTERYYTIHLKNARLSGIRHWFPNTVDPAAFNYPHMEEVSITYQSMLIRYENGGIEYEISATQP